MSNLSAQEFDRVFVFLNKNPNKAVLPQDSVDALMEMHFKNMGDLGTQGKLINAGPFEGGGGLFVMNSPSVDTVKQWLQTDPAVRANRWSIEVYPFTTTVGGSCVVGAVYEMGMYSFVRYAPSNEIANYKSNVNEAKEVSMKQLIASLNEKGDLIMAGYFGSNEGGVLVLKDDSSLEKIKSSAAANTGAITFEFKELWIAKGSFCEE
ncbi:MAG: YciI family protein [Cyclobacteriaceae bacterium]|nr:YciI family protein [Cyclobacteriaceae bacterium]